jgi:hypothetical protein
LGTGADTAVGATAAGVVAVLEIRHQTSSLKCLEENSFYCENILLERETGVALT